MAAPIDLSTATTLEEQVYLGILEMHKLEQAITDNRPDNTQVNFDTENDTVALSVSLATTLNVSGNSAVINVTSYL